MHLYKTSRGNILKSKVGSFLIMEKWDSLINQPDLRAHLLHLSAIAETISEDEAGKLINDSLLPPIGSQEVWAAGVTYQRSRDARMEESEDAGAADCYQRVYEAARPELLNLPRRNLVGVFAPAIVQHPGFQPRRVCQFRGHSQLRQKPTL